MSRIALTILPLGLLSACLATSGEPIERYEHPRTAVVLMDIQRDFLEEDGRMPVGRAQVEPMIAVVKDLVSDARARGLPVVQVRNVFSRNAFVANWFRNQAAVEGGAGTALDPRTAMLSATVFDKNAPDAFSNDELDAFLRENRVDQLVLAGVYAGGCVKWTARGALNRGYRITIVRSAVADSDEGARAEALEGLAERGVRVVASSAEVEW